MKAHDPVTKILAPTQGGDRPDIGMGTYEPRNRAVQAYVPILPLILPMPLQPNPPVNAHQIIQRIVQHFTQPPVQVVAPVARQHDDAGEVVAGEGGGAIEVVAANDIGGANDVGGGIEGGANDVGGGVSGVEGNGGGGGGVNEVVVGVNEVVGGVNEVGGDIEEANGEGGNIDVEEGILEEAVLEGSDNEEVDDIEGIREEGINEVDDNIEVVVGEGNIVEVGGIRLDVRDDQGIINRISEMFHSLEGEGADEAVEAGNVAVVVVGNREVEEVNGADEGAIAFLEEPIPPRPIMETVRNTSLRIVTQHTFVNPFRSPIYLPDEAHNMPCYSNAFIVEFQ